MPSLDTTLFNDLHKAMRGMPSRASMAIGGQALSQQASKANISVGKASNTVGVKPTGHATMPTNARPGLVEKDVEFHRGGKTFTEKRMVREGEELPQQGVAPAVAEPEPKDKEPEFEIPQEHKEQLNKYIKAAKGMKPGETRKVNNVPVTMNKNGFYGVGSRHPIMVNGLRGLSLIVDKLGSLSTTGGAMMVGDIQGKTVKQGIGAQQLERTGEAKVSAIEQQQRIAQQDAEKARRIKEAHDKVDRKYDEMIQRIEAQRKMAHDNIDKRSSREFFDTFMPKEEKPETEEEFEEKPETEEEFEEKPETEEEFEDKPASEKQADAVVTLTDQSDVTQKEEKKPTGVTVVSAKDYENKKVADMTEDELKHLAQNVGIDTEGKSVDDIRRALRTEGKTTQQGQPVKKPEVSEAPTVAAKKPEEKERKQAKTLVDENKPEASEAKPEASEAKPEASEAKPEASEAKPKPEAKPEKKSEAETKPDDLVYKPTARKYRNHTWNKISLKEARKRLEEQEKNVESDIQNAMDKIKGDDPMGTRRDSIIQSIHDRLEENKKYVKSRAIAEWKLKKQTENKSEDKFR